ncbi:MAG: hypothetical protein GX481_00645 [Atopobium sp.]|jgi:hypothetical protein|nr:hypothetical protein [Atopobium sp.]
MAQLITIQRVEIDDKLLTARIHLSKDAPAMTNDDLEGTARVYYLLPHIVEHACLGDAGQTFRDVMGATELAHLLEHVTVELLAQTNLAGEISCGRTAAVADDPRSWDIELACPDDVLVAAALASAVWILQWAYTGGTNPKPDASATVRGLVGLVKSLSLDEAPQGQPQKQASVQEQPDKPHTKQQEEQGGTKAGKNDSAQPTEEAERTVSIKDSRDEDTSIDTAVQKSSSLEGLAHKDDEAAEKKEHIPEPHAVR